MRLLSSFHSCLLVQVFNVAYSLQTVSSNPLQVISLSISFIQNEDGLLWDLSLQTDLQRPGEPWRLLANDLQCGLLLVMLLPRCWNSSCLHPLVIQLGAPSLHCLKTAGRGADTLDHCVLLFLSRGSHSLTVSVPRMTMKAPRLPQVYRSPRASTLVHNSALALSTYLMHKHWSMNNTVSNNNDLQNVSLNSLK